MTQVGACGTSRGETPVRGGENFALLYIQDTMNKNMLYLVPLIFFCKRCRLPGKAEMD
jgi:hypothetical protein